MKLLEWANFIGKKADKRMRMERYVLVALALPELLANGRLLLIHLSWLRQSFSGFRTSLIKNNNDTQLVVARFLHDSSHSIRCDMFQLR